MIISSHYPVAFGKRGRRPPRMLRLLVITFSPRLMTGNWALGGNESPQQASQVLEHENGICKDWKSLPPSMCFYFQRAITHRGQRGWDFKNSVSSGSS